MFIIAALAGLAWFEILFIAAFLILLCIGTAFDRNGRAFGMKWGVAACGFLIFTIFSYVRGSQSLGEFITNSVLTLGGFWTSFGIYLLVGLGYSVIEFMVSTRSRARAVSEEWEAYKRSEEFKKAELTTQEYYRRFISYYVQNTDQLINLKVNGSSIDPVVNKKTLAKHLGAWSFLWPFYAISLIFGNLLTEITQAIVDATAKLSGAFVRMSFKGIFTI